MGCVGKKASMELPEALDLDSSHVMPSFWDQPTPHNSLPYSVILPTSSSSTQFCHYFEGPHLFIPLQTASKQSVAFHCCTPNVSQVRVIR